MRTNSSGTESYIEPTFHGCKAYNDGTQSINNNSATAVTFGAEEYDTDGLHSTSSNTSRITIPTGLGGKWMFRYHVSFIANASLNQRIAFLRLNGTGDSTNLIGSEMRTIANATVDMGLNGGAIAALVATDYVELFVYQDSGTARTIGYSLATSRAGASMLEAVFLG